MEFGDQREVGWRAGSDRVRIASRARPLNRAYFFNYRQVAAMILEFAFDSVRIS
jgi:hypothetical protein